MLAAVDSGAFALRAGSSTPTDRHCVLGVETIAICYLLLLLLLLVAIAIAIAIASPPFSNVVSFVHRLFALSLSDALGTLRTFCVVLLAFMLVADFLHVHFYIPAIPWINVESGGS